MSITLELPEDQLTELFDVRANELPRQVQIELACALYARGALTHAQASALAGLDRFQIGDELVRRNIPIHYTEADLGVDLAYGRGE
jgi:predicted HTH domain antitoxin